MTSPEDDTSLLFSMEDGFDNRPETISLLAKLRVALPSLEALLEEYSIHWGFEDRIYRFYHQSFKVYWLQAPSSKERIGSRPDEPLGVGLTRRTAGGRVRSMNPVE